MRTIQKSKGHEGKCLPNVLPCRINRNGPVNTSKRYWNPTKTPDGKMIAYFRGRKLHGRPLKVPAGYKGVVVSATDNLLPRENPRKGEVDDDEDVEEEPEVKIMEELSEFDEIMLWGHEVVMDESDPYVRGLEEWLGFAEQIHSYSSDEGDASTKGK